MNKIIIDKLTKKVKFNYSNDEKIIMGKNTISIPNNPPARVVRHAGNQTTTYLGGTVICDHDFVDNCDIIENVENVPEDFKPNKYKYDKKLKKFEINSDYQDKDKD